MKRRRPRGYRPGRQDSTTHGPFARGVYEAARRIGPGRTLSYGEIARAVGAPGFDRAAARFDEVVYGRRPAAAGDVEAARTAWDEALR